MLPLLSLLLCGLALGSFVAALTYRLPRKQNIVSQPSTCPSCNARLGIKDLVPVCSWLFSRGKCAHCGAAISWRYPLIELLTAGGLLALYASSLAPLSSPLFYLYAALWLVILTIIVIDLEHYLIPDRLTFCFILLAFLIIWQTDHSLLFAVLRGLALAGGFFALGWIVSTLKGKPALGLGDVKLLLGIGVLLSWAGIIAFLFYSGVLGILLGITWKIVKKSDHFPFAPALLGALILAY